MDNLDWLNEVAPVAEEPKQVVSRKIDRNPTGLRLRIYSDGRVFPSQELVEKFNLNYTAQGGSEQVANGLDIFASNEWGQFPSNAPSKVLLIAAVPKDLPKVDLFSQVDYNEDGTPKKSVMNQGSKRLELLTLVENTYGIIVDKFVDLEVGNELVNFTGLPKYYIPKSLKRGPKAGSMTYVERTGLQVYPITLVRDEVQSNVLEGAGDVLENNNEESN